MSTTIECLATDDKVRREHVFGCSACGRSHPMLFVPSYSRPAWPWVGICEVAMRKVYMRDKEADHAE